MTALHTTTSGPNVSTDTITTVWVHGVDSDAHVWDSAVEAVAVDHPCVAVDLPGHGASPAPSDPAAYTRDAVLDDLDTVIAGIRAVDPDQRIVFIGHSLGGYLGLAHALTRDDHSGIDALVLVSTGPGFRDPDAMQSWNERVEANAPSYGVSELAATIAFHADSMVMDRITELTLPISLVIGDGDKGFLGANDYLERKLPHATRTTVEGARHFVMKSHPESVAGAVATVVDALQT